jgi:circadian clock protein KaiB
MSAPEAAAPDLTLFVNGATDLSARAVRLAKQLCDVHLGGRHRLAVVDVNDDPTAVLGHHVLVTPTLLRHQPLPTRRYAGDLSDTDKVLVALNFSVAVGPR